ncbi:Hypothetical predicted protein [Mytilus galloprovincialis]|uniref:Reverse transcriptase domain-containing protein n=1 Tax=Mytilus galloprovincialis TaxID=29158 RepID=A0A8B6C744_MYTGA|nr:Hypothetical predicted protein [Mytilus galloprovincialis]
MVVHLFGATSSPSCANYALRKTASELKGTFDNQVVDTVLKNCYVDDCLKSVSSTNKAIALISNIQSLLKQGGFRIAKWVSNDRDVINFVPVEERAKEIKDLDLDQDSVPIDRALGIQWCVDSDKFHFNIDVKDKPATRRGILSMTSSVFDPLEFLAPFCLVGKSILQELCRLGIGWDDAIPQVLSEKWTQWLCDLEKLSEFKVNRCLKPSGFGEIVAADLHHFADASEIGYGVVSYLRIENEEGNTYCSFIMGKSRVTPLKQVTIPRLELTAATVAVRTNKMILKELEIPVQRSYFWIDSMTVLRYIKNTTSRFHTFVANRLAVIHEGSNIFDWRYISTKLNPADLASRGVSAEGLLRMDQWIVPPDFLLKSTNEWPDSLNCDSDIVCTSDPEVKKVSVSTIVTSQPNQDNWFDILNKLIDHNSSWYSLKRSVGWILKVRKELLRRVSNKKEDIKMTLVKESDSIFTCLSSRAIHLEVFRHCVKVKFIGKRTLRY